MRRRKAMAEASRHRQGAAVAARPDTKGMVSPILIWPTVKEMHHSFEDLKQKHQGHGGLLSPPLGRIIKAFQKRSGLEASLRIELIISSDKPEKWRTGALQVTDGQRHRDPDVDRPERKAAL